MVTPPAAAVPECVGPYQIREPLGRGGMGEVFRGYDARLDRQVALKRVQPDSKKPEDARRRFHREARAAARLGHSSIVKLFDWLEQDGSCWIVMELVQGRSLRELLEHGLLSPREVARVGLDIAAGLAVAHEAGIVHRDIKPDNVMVTTHGEVKILDFGLAKQTEESDRPMLSAVSASNVIVGSVPAMSPEQALGKPVDGRSDLFSLGTLLFELLTGEHPFRTHNQVETLTRICTVTPGPLAEDVPDGLRELIARLLQKQPDDRPASAHQVITALESLAAPKARLRESLRVLADASASAAGASIANAPGMSSTGVAPAATPPAANIEPVSEVTEALSEVQPAGPEHPQQRPAGRPRRRSWWIGVVALAGAGAIIASMVAFNSMSRSRAARESAGATDGPDLDRMSAQERYARGMELLRRSDRSVDVDRAVALFEYSIARDAGSAPAHAGLARAYWQRYVSNNDESSWLERARVIAERAVELDPFLAAARISRGLAYCKSNRPDDAENDFRAVLRLDPDEPQALFGMGCVYQARKDFDQALVSYRASLAGDPDNLMVQNELGQLLVRKGQYAEAELVFRETIERWPDSYMGYRNLGVVHYLQGDVSKAAAMTQKALEIEPSGSLYSNLGTYYFMQGYYLQATQAFERALDSPHMANRYYAWANLADAYRWTPGEKHKAKEVYGRAIELLRRELESKPGDLTLGTRLAVYLAKAGDPRGAVDHLHSLEILADDANALYRAALTLEISGERQEALQRLDEALRAGYSRHEVESDPELLKLRDDRRYHELLMRVPR